MFLSSGDVQGSLSLVVKKSLSVCPRVTLLYLYDPCEKSTLVVMCVGTFSNCDVWGVAIYLWQKCPL